MHAAMYMRMRSARSCGAVCSICEKAWCALSYFPPCISFSALSYIASVCLRVASSGTGEPASVRGMRRRLLDFASFLAVLLIVGATGGADFVAIALSGSSRLEISLWVLYQFGKLLRGYTGSCHSRSNRFTV